MINNEVTVNKGIVHAEHVQKGKIHFPFGAEISALRAAERRWGDAKVLEHANIRRQPRRRK